ncbi:MAG: hypothetical protein EOP09_12435, partial [Proteobacteria bacterium]
MDSGQASGDVFHSQKRPINGANPMKSLKEKLTTTWQERQTLGLPSVLARELSSAELAARIDHTSLRGGVLPVEIEQLARDGRGLGAASVCVHPGFLPTVTPLLQGSPTLACTVLNFPFGFQDPDAVLYELEQSKRLGAQELDIVMRYGDLRAQRYEQVYSELCRWIEQAGTTPVKVIIESGVLSNEEIIHCCEIYAGAGVDLQP